MERQFAQLVVHGLRQPQGQGADGPNRALLRR
jgi:hypothetical protein